MKPKKPLPTARPFLTILTATFCRPQGLAENLRSVYRQTLAHEIEQIVLPDHIGVSPNHAVYGRLPWYATAPRGAYVHVLGDDDVLADDQVVERIKRFAERQAYPDVIVMKCKKGDTEYPKCGVTGEPTEGDIDLCCYVVKRQVWATCMQTYRPHYKCDYGFYQTLKDYGASLTPLDQVIAVGRVGGGRPEAVDW